MGLDLRLYGRGWEKHPTLSRFAGIADNKNQLSLIYRASRISMQPARMGRPSAIDGRVGVWRIFSAAAMPRRFDRAAIPDDLELVRFEANQFGFADQDLFRAADCRGDRDRWLGLSGMIRLDEPFVHGGIAGERAGRICTIGGDDLG